MTKLLFTADWHLCDRRPGTRIDADFFKSQDAKVLEIFELGRKYKVNKIIHGGDLFNQPLVDLHLINHVLQLFKTNCIPIEIVLGNHDLLGYNAASVARTALGTLLRAGVVQETAYSHVNAVSNPTIESYHHINGAPKVIVAHDMLSPTPLLFPHVLYSQVAELFPEALILCGHYHTPFEYVDKTYKTTFLNPGCLMRCKINEGAHRPHVYVISLAEEGITHYEKVYLKSPKSKYAIFDVDKHTTTKATEKSFDGFIADLKATSLQSYDLKELIAKVAEEKKIDAQVTNEALQRVGAQQE